jgi:hypothetical protein
VSAKVAEKIKAVEAAAVEVEVEEKKEEEESKGEEAEDLMARMISGSSSLRRRMSHWMKKYEMNIYSPRTRRLTCLLWRLLLRHPFPSSGSRRSRGRGRGRASCRRQNHCRFLPQQTQGGG